jgi:hypothetical protein
MIMAEPRLTQWHVRLVRNGFLDLRSDVLILVTATPVNLSGPSKGKDMTRQKDPMARRDSENLL